MIMEKEEGHIQRKLCYGWAHVTGSTVVPALAPHRIRRDATSTLPSQYQMAVLLSPLSAGINGHKVM